MLPSSSSNKKGNYLEDLKKFEKLSTKCAELWHEYAEKHVYF